MHAIGQAAALIQEGDLDVAFCGGVEASLEDLVFADLCASRLLARPADVPDPACRPFGLGRTGLVVGEGAAVLVLESQEHAERRGGRTRAAILGFGAGTGEPTTALRDRAEAEAIRTLFPARAADGRVVAPKAAHGMLFSASAPLEAAEAVLAMEHGVIPPMPNGGPSDPECGIRLSSRPQQPAEGVRTALVNALGVFGEAASLLLARPAA
jgi:3-oxoacyl-[acyl-carrier-protein] synthase II